MEGGSPLASIQERPAWKAHARVLGNLWKQHEAARLSKVRRWSDANLGAIRASSSTVFYPFGGPDILYATAFYPEAQAYVLVGLEPVGTVPDLMALPPESLDKSLKEMETYITPILQISFFRTNDMEEELTQKGTLPILLVFLAGTGHRILDVQPLALAADGTPVAPQGPGLAHAVRIDFEKEGSTSTQSLYYFSQDLSDAALKKVPQFTDFLQNMSRPTTFLKAASYLMFRDHFSTVRNFILTGTAAVLEDDSGIPLKYFQSKKWDVRFFGTYTGPHQAVQDVRTERPPRGLPRFGDGSAPGFRHRVPAPRGGVQPHARHDQALTTSDLLTERRRPPQKGRPPFGSG